MKSLSEGVETLETPHPKSSGQLPVESTEFLADKSADKETLLAGDRYSYPASDFEFCLVIKHQYAAVVAELKSFVDGLEFEYRKFQLQAPRLKQKISIIREIVEHREQSQERQRNLEGFYVYPDQMLNTMKISAEVMGFWAGLPHSEGNIISEIHQLRVITLSFFNAEGTPDINMKEFKDQIQSVNSKWTVLKNRYYKLEDKGNIRDFFLPILAQTRKTIDVLQKAHIGENLP